MEEEIYGRIMADLGRILRQQYEMKWMKYIEAEARPVIFTC